MSVAPVPLARTAVVVSKLAVPAGCWVAVLTRRADRQESRANASSAIGHVSQPLETSQQSPPVLG